jgi:hypothetical protein
MDRLIQSDQTLWARDNSAEALAAAIIETTGMVHRTGLRRSISESRHSSPGRMFLRGCLTSTGRSSQIPAAAACNRFLFDRFLWLNDDTSNP